MACRALLQRMAPEHKFATAAKLCGEVLGGVADGLLPLQECEEVLGDALRCLASKDIKVGHCAHNSSMNMCECGAGGFTFCLHAASMTPHSALGLQLFSVGLEQLSLVDQESKRCGVLSATLVRSVSAPCCMSSSCNLALTTCFSWTCKWI